MTVCVCTYVCVCVCVCSTFECEEFWVFERAFYTGIIRRPGPEGSRWRLVETLNNEVCGCMCVCVRARPYVLLKA